MYRVVFLTQTGAYKSKHAIGSFLKWKVHFLICPAKEDTLMTENFPERTLVNAVLIMTYIRYAVITVHRMKTW